MDLKLIVIKLRRKTWKLIYLVLGTLHSKICIPEARRIHSLGVLGECPRGIHILDFDTSDQVDRIPLHMVQSQTRVLKKIIAYPECKKSLKITS